MKFEEYVSTLPSGIMSGDDVALPPEAVRRMLRLAGARAGESVYHVGCGDGSALRRAVEEFGARRAVGIEIDQKKADAARSSLADLGERCQIVCADVLDADLSGADIVLFWFADGPVAEAMVPRFESLGGGVRIVTVWGAPPGCLPERVDFPFVLSATPFRRASSVREQLLAVLGVECVDFVTAWEHSERYARALAGEDAGRNRFLTIIQAVTMWISARNLGVSCTKEMPESIRTYAGILRTFYDIEVGHLLEEGRGGDKAI